MREVQRSYHVVRWALMLIALSTISLIQEVTEGSPADDAQQLRVIPFNVTAGVLGGGASVGAFRGGAIFMAPPEPLGEIPAVFLPAHTDSFITQSITLPADSVGKNISVEVIFSASEEGTVNLFVETITSTVGGNRLGRTQERVLHITGRGLKKELFFGVTGAGDVFTISVGRRAKDNPQDTNPGVIRIEAVKISYVPQ